MSSPTTPNNTLSLTLLLLPLFFLSSVCGSEAEFTKLMEFSTDNLIGDAFCKLVDCGQGTCKSSDDNPPFIFNCECDPGWTKLKIANLILPPCILPNCSLNFDCGLPKFQLPTNFSDPCNYTWCGDGTCVLTGDGNHTCRCNDGSFNLNNMTTMPCLNDCSLGANCTNVHLGPSPPQISPPPGGPSSGSSGSGTGKAGSGSQNNGNWIGILGSIVALLSLNLV